MKRIFFAFIISSILLFRVGYAGIMMGEGSITLKPFQEKKVRFFCVFSENPGRITYTPVFTDNLKRFVKSIEPSSFTLSTINCSGDQTQRRKCIAELCNKGEESMTRMPTITFSCPIEFSFDLCDGMPCLGFYGKLRTVQGGIKNIGSVGVAKITEVVDFWVHYYPLNGWLIVFSLIILVFLVLILWFSPHLFVTSQCLR